jgi:8-oxo-dGTP diphosphatase
MIHNIPLKHRIRAGAILLHSNRLLLVEHTDSNGSWWTVPGGGVEDRETIYDAVIRECIEEVGLVVTPVRISAIRQYISDYFSLNQIEFFILCHIDSDSITMKNLVGKNDEMSITNIQWISLADLHSYNILPAVLKTLDFASESIVFIGSDYDELSSDKQ